MIGSLDGRQSAKAMCFDGVDVQDVEVKQADNSVWLVAKSARELWWSARW
jgi:hypothetical protein